MQSTIEWDGVTERRECLLENTITTLSAMTNALPDLSDLLVSVSAGHVEYRAQTKDGFPSVATSENLLSESGVGVMRFKMQVGDSIEPHQHAENEYIIVISGSFDTWIGEDKYHIEPGQFVHYPSGMEHHGTITSELDCICVTVPKASGYPNGTETRRLE